MSTHFLVGLGSRLKSVRTAAGLTQAEMAECLGIADRTYKFYELEKREMPFSTAMNFASQYKLDLNWLATGEGPQVSLTDPEITAAAAEAVISALGEKSLSLSAELMGKHIAYVRGHCMKSGEDPKQVAETLISLLPEQRD